MFPLGVSPKPPIKPAHKSLKQNTRHGTLSYGQLILCTASLPCITCFAK